MNTAVAAPGSIRASLRLLNWVYNPFQSLGVTAVYDLLSTQAPTERGLWLNLGYWREAQTLDDACQAMAALLADTAANGAGGRGRGRWFRLRRSGYLLGPTVSATAHPGAQYHGLPGRDGPHPGDGTRAR